MPALSLREAARRFAVSRATLAKSLENGTVSGVRDDAGHWRIDAAELVRVYQPRAEPRAVMGRAIPAQMSHDGPPPEPPPTDEGLAVRLARAEAELAAEREKVELLQRHLDDVRRMLPAPDAKPRRWWPW